MSKTTDIVHHVDSETVEPRTHAIVIGLGYYPYGGNIEGVSLDNLGSPPRTARAIADWLITEFQDPDCPLASLSLVVSDELAFEYTHPLTHEVFTVPQGSTGDIVDAIDAWAARAGSNVKNRTVFYYCGHGLRVGTLDFILSRSFGEKPNQFWDGVLKRSSIDSPMRIIGPGHQIFFYDTCRNEGTGVLGGDPEARTVLSTRQQLGNVPRQSRLFATAEGALAHGRTNGLSLFAEEFIGTAKSTAVRKNPKTGWWTNTGELQRHMERFVKDQRCQLEGDQLDLSFIGSTPTKIPVVLSCDPTETICSVNIHCHSTEKPVVSFRGDMLSDDAELEWRLSLSRGMHRFAVTACVAGEFPSVDESIWIESPYTEIVLDMKGEAVK